MDKGLPGTSLGLGRLLPASCDSYDVISLSTSTPLFLLALELAGGSRDNSSGSRFNSRGSLYA
jgi:hypothetical protein